jgi:hypothetical protein
LSRHLPPNRGHPSPRLVGKVFERPCESDRSNNEKMLTGCTSAGGATLSANSAGSRLLGSPPVDIWT